VRQKLFSCLTTHFLRIFWTWLWFGWDWSWFRKVDVIGSELDVSEQHTVLVGWSGLTSRLDSLPTRSFPFQLAGTPNEGSQPHWWCPESNPHCLFPETLVRSVFSNISSSKLAEHSWSTSTSFRMDRTLISCASQAFWRIAHSLYVLNMRFWSFGMRWRGYRLVSSGRLTTWLPHNIQQGTAMIT